MANTRSAEKRIVQTAKRRLRNRTHRTRMRSAVKELRSAVQAGDGQTARELLPAALSLIDHTAQRRAVHANAAARTKARLVRAVRALES